MADEVKVKVRTADAGTLGGTLWFGGWLFTLGFLKLPLLWKGVLALLLWPYYLGVFFRRG